MKQLAFFTGNRSFLFSVASIFSIFFGFAAQADSKNYASVPGWQVAYDIDRSSCTAFSKSERRRHKSGPSLGLPFLHMVRWPLQR